MTVAAAFMAFGAIVVVLSAVPVISRFRRLGLMVCVLGNVVFVVGALRMAGELIR